MKLTAVSRQRLVFCKRIKYNLSMYMAKKVVKGFMEKLMLVWPAEEHREAAEDYLEEHISYGENELHGAALMERMEFDPWLAMSIRNRDAATANPHWVQSSTFFVFRESDKRMIGMVDIRHRLNDFLSSFGGHIGYGVRPTERQKGYAKEILRLALEYARSEIGLEKVMIACYKENAGSWKTILANGGRLEREFVHTDGKKVQVYWVNL